MADSTKILSFGRTTAADRGTITNCEATWPEIIKLFETPVRRQISTERYLSLDPKGRADSKNTGLFFGGRCADGRRSDSSLVSRSIVNLDLDYNCQAIWDDFSMIGAVPTLDGLSYLIHTTRSHSDDEPRMRILVPLSREVTPAEYEPVARAIAEMIDPTMKAVARESYVPAQGMYFPSVSKDQEYHFAAFEGDFFDVDAALAKYPADNTATWPKVKGENVTAYVPGRRMAHPEEKKALAPIITAVHRAYDPWSFIEEFLSDIYVPAGDRYAPVGATGAPSVRIYDGAFIQSDHASDPACGQHNTFDLGRIHLFGHLDNDYDTSSMSPVEWPSYKAMVEFMMEREEVREALAEVEAEVSAERNQNMVAMLGDLDDDEDDDVPAAAESVDPDFDDLIGCGKIGSLKEERAKAEKEENKKLRIEDVLRKVRKAIAKAESLDELEARVEIIRGFPISDFRDLHRELVAGDVQKKYAELAGEKITKAMAKKMLKPTVENLRDQMSDQPLPDWLENWVYITSDNSFLNLETKEILGKEGFNGRFNRAAGEMFGADELGRSKLTAFDVATQIFCVPMPYRTKYHPNKPALFSEEGLFYANTYRAAVIEDSAYKGDEGVRLLKRLVADLFPEQEHQDMLLDFFAHCVQHPGKKLHYALLVKGAEQEGKSLLAHMMSKMLGKANFGIIGPDLLKEKFNGWSYEKLFCVVEEIKITGKEAYEVLNKVKPVITNSEIAVRRMQKDVTTEMNFCNMYLTTNFEDCLPLEEDNTRFLVLFTRFRTNQEVKDWRSERVAKEGFDYVSKLYEHIENNPMQFYKFFTEYTFSKHYNPNDRAPWTEFKAIMAEDGKTDERQLLEEMLAHGEHPGVTDDVLIWSCFRAELDRKDLSPWLKGGAVSGFLKPLGFFKSKKVSWRENGVVKNTAFWTRNPGLVDRKGNLTQEGRNKFFAALKAVEELTDLDAMGDNVVPMRR